MLLMLTLTAWSAPVKYMAVARVQPDGDTLHCWVSGDEFFHRLHDAQDYTIVLNPATGEYVYAQLADGRLEPTTYRPGQTDPATLGLSPGLMPSADELRLLHKAWEVPEQYRRDRPKTSGANHGVLNNIVIFIRFSDETSCASSTFASVDAMFNDSSSSAVSMINYFDRTSYGNLHVVTHYYPAPSGGVVQSFQDSHPRSYYQPYSAANPGGYIDADDKRSREFTLLAAAVASVSSSIPSSLNLDMDNDGTVDNVCFVVSGTYTGWNELLWPHKWSLYDRNVYINGKRVYTFNLQLANSGSHYFGVSTLCHEMSHTLGNPDIYNYYQYTDITPAGSWDLMCVNQDPPQQSNSLFKYRYLNWLDNIPELTDSGTYTMQSLASGPNHAYKVASANRQQWYVLEYRNVADTFDSSIPNYGMLVWRYNSSSQASNANFDWATVPHELWLFRPNSPNDTTNGIIASAYLGQSGRTAFGAASSRMATSTNPYPYLCDGTPDTTFFLTNISISANHQSVSFTFVPNGGRHCSTVSTFPLVQDFEQGDEGCWTYRSADPANDSRTGVITNTSSNPSHGGSYQFAFSSYSRASDYNQYLISPRLQASNPLHLTFYYRRYSGQSEVFDVKYSTTGNLMSDFTNTIHHQVATSNGWQLCDVLVPQQARYVAIDYSSDYLYYLYVDDIRLSDTLTVARDTTYIHVTDTLWTWSHDTVSIGFHDTVYMHQYVEVIDTVYEIRYDTVFRYDDRPWAQLSVLSADALVGQTVGSGRYRLGDMVEIGAAAIMPGYSFDHWMDNNVENPRLVPADSTTAYTAYFSLVNGSDATKTVFHDTVMVRDTVWMEGVLYDTVYVPIEVVVYDTVYIPGPTFHDTVVYHDTVVVDTVAYHTLLLQANSDLMGMVVGSGSLAEGSLAQIGALPYQGYRFLAWSDGETMPVRTIEVRQDVALQAIFGEVVSVSDVVSDPDRVFAQGHAIHVMAPQGSRVVVYNTLGQIVAQRSLPVQGGSVTIDGLPQGFYAVQVDAKPAHKIIIAK